MRKEELMRGINQLKIECFACQDIRLIKKEAVFVIKINENGNLEWCHRNKEGRLSVIAIIGPTQQFNRSFNEAVLLEIGLKRGKPYHEAFIANRKSGNEPLTLHKRRQWFSLSPEQWLKVRGPIFSLLQEITNERVNKWKCGPNNPYYIRTPKHRWTIRGKKMIKTESKKPYLSGIRFSIALKDQMFIKFVYWLEIYFNKNLQKHLKGMANFIDKRLAPYRWNGHKRKFSKLGGARDILKSFNSQKKLPEYLMAKMIEKLPNGEKNRFYYDIIDLFCLTKDKIPVEDKLAKSALVSGNFNLSPAPQVRVTTGLNRKKDHIVFELFFSGNTLPCL